MNVARRYQAVNQIPITLDGVAATLGDLNRNKMYLAALVSEDSEKIFLRGKSPVGIFVSLKNLYMAAREDLKYAGYELMVSELQEGSASAVAGRSR